MKKGKKIMKKKMYKFIVIPVSVICGLVVLLFSILNTLFPSSNWSYMSLCAYGIYVMLLQTRMEHQKISDAQFCVEMAVMLLSVMTTIIF